MVITARSEEDLEETKRLISCSAPGVTVQVVAGDIGNLDSLSSLCSKLFEIVDTSKHKLGLLINNAGTMNDFETPFLSRTPSQIQDFMGLNLTSMMVLTTSFLTALPPPGQRYVVTISSYLGKVFVPKFNLYGVSRAARNAFVGVLKAEAPDVRQFSYSPGPCDTDLFKSTSKDLPIMQGLTPLSPKQSIEKLISLLREDKFEIGSVISYYDK